MESQYTNWKGYQDEPLELAIVNGPTNRDMEPPGFSLGVHFCDPKNKWKFHVEMTIWRRFIQIGWLY